MNSIFDELSNHITIKLNTCYDICHTAYYTEEKVHPDYDVWYILDGEINIVIDNITYTAGKDDVVFFYPGINYKSFINKAHCELIYIHFDFSIHDNRRFLEDFNYSGIINKEVLETISPLFKEAYLRYKKSNYSQLFMIKSYFVLLLTTIINMDSAETLNRVYFKKNDKKDIGGFNTLQPIFNYISENLHKVVSITELSNIVNMSEKYFIHYFKQTVGLPPIQYINELKMNKARKLLYEGKNSIKQISEAIGYADPYSFSKAFKKIYGISPSKFTK
jgi:AraC-like DNA-binding protein